MRMATIGLALGGIALAGVAVAAPSGFQVKPWVYDPDDLAISQAAWVANVGNPGHALYLTKDGDTPENAASGASIHGVNGKVISELGFDYRNDGWCGAGAPRFNVYLADGSYFFFGCSHGTATPAPGDSLNWTRVRFDDTDASWSGVGPTATWPGFGTVQVAAIEIVFDEGTDVGPGFAYLDNIDVNGVLIGKPGNHK